MARATQQAADMLDQAGEQHAVEQVGKDREVNLPLSFRAFQASGRHLNRQYVSSVVNT